MLCIYPLNINIRGKCYFDQYLYHSLVILHFACHIVFYEGSNDQYLNFSKNKK